MTAADLAPSIDPTHTRELGDAMERGGNDLRPYETL